MRKKTNKLDNFFDYINLGKQERKIYKFLLLKKESTIKQIKGGLKLSEKTIRTQLKNLMTLGFINRKIVENGRLKYVYYTENISISWKNLKKKIQKIIKELSS